MGSVLALQLLTFVTLTVVALVTQARFFSALWQREPAVAAGSAGVLDDLVQRPSQFLHLVTAGTRARLAALTRRWPYPEVESRRRIALASIVLSLISLAWLMFAPGG